MGLRRGFPTEAKRLADEVRSEIGLAPSAALNPWHLAEHLAVPIWTLSSYRARGPAACDLLLGAELASFSAMVAKVGHRRVVIHNDGHGVPRQHANICHELAHVLLFHDGKTLEGGWLEYDADQEDEAKWLGGVLLVTDEACLAACRADVPLTRAAADLGVSEELMRWRRNKSGAEVRVRRERARRGAYAR